MLSLADLLKGINLDLPGADGRPPEPADGGEGRHDPTCIYCGATLNPAGCAELRAWLVEARPLLSRLFAIVERLHPADRVCIVPISLAQGGPIIRKMLGSP